MNLRIAIVLCFFLAGISSVHAQLTLDLKPGDENPEVVLLQQILNLLDYPIAASGPGSKGRETHLFGAQTSAALKTFQCDRGIACNGDPEVTGYGLVGPQTRGVLNVFAHHFTNTPKTVKEIVRVAAQQPGRDLLAGVFEPDIFSGTSTAERVMDKSTPETPTHSTSTFIFTRNLKSGFTGEDVRALQVFLNTHGYLVAQSGPGSPGSETVLFGAGTRKALIQFQIAQSIKPAAGFFGSITRKVVNSM